MSDKVGVISDLLKQRWPRSRCRAWLDALSGEEGAPRVYPRELDALLLRNALKPIGTAWRLCVGDEALGAATEFISNAFSREDYAEVLADAGRAIGPVIDALGGVEIVACNWTWPSARITVGCVGYTSVSPRKSCSGMITVLVGRTGATCVLLAEECW